MAFDGNILEHYADQVEKFGTNDVQPPKLRKFSYPLLVHDVRHNLNKGMKLHAAITEVLVAENVSELDQPCMYERIERALNGEDPFSPKAASRRKEEFID